MIFGWKKKTKPPLARSDERTVLITTQPEKAGLETAWVETALATHIGTRAYQQDAAYVTDSAKASDTAFGILCDGMGGMEAGELVSSDVVAFFANRLLSLPQAEEIPAFFEQALHDANDMVLSRYTAKGQESGTTLVCTALLEDRLFWASVGDSRIYIIRNGEIARVTRDHNYALHLQELVEAGRLSLEEASEDPRRDALISYLGAPSLELVDVARSPFSLCQGDLILLCSDGLTKSLSDARILEVILSHTEDLKELARLLTLTAFDESPGGQDNTSVILMRYTARYREKTPKR